MQFIISPSRYPVAQIGDYLVAVISDCSRPCELSLLLVPTFLLEHYVKCYITNIFCSIYNEFETFSLFMSS